WRATAPLAAETRTGSVAGGRVTNGIGFGHDGPDYPETKRRRARCYTPAMSERHRPAPSHLHRGRGAQTDPVNRFSQIAVELDPAEITDDDLSARTRYLDDTSRSVISTNTSPDVGFDASLNPYRGCEHGCSYCYARPTHEYLGLTAGLDFERVILVKRQAPALLQRALDARGWTPKVLALSGVTDPYQPVERKLAITRGCLAVLARYRNPVGIITKNA